jgi:trehalose-6-phosphate hydrolase
MLASLLHGLQGTPYVYQGEELGMTNVGFDSLDDYKDIESLNFYRLAREKGVSHDSAIESMKRIGRDNARTPMQWDKSTNAGFTTGTPWIKVNPNADTINAKNALEDESSVFYHYKNLIACRKKYSIFTEGRFEFVLRSEKDLFAYKRESSTEILYCINSFSEKNLKTEILSHIDGDLADYTLLAHNYEDVNTQGKSLELRPYESLLLYKKRS